MIIRKNKRERYKMMIYLFVSVAFLFFLFGLWYVRSSLQSIEDELCEQMSYTIQSTGDYIYYRMKGIMYSADSLKQSLSPILDEKAENPYENYQEIKNDLMATLDKNVISYCRIYMSEPRLYTGQFTNEWFLGDMQQLRKEKPEREWNYAFWEAPHEEKYAIVIGSRQVISYYCPILSRSDFNTINGVVGMDLDISEIEKILQKSGETSLYLVNENGKVLVNTADIEAGEGLFGEDFHFDIRLDQGKVDLGRTTYIYNRLKDSSWYLVGKIDNADIYRLNSKIAIVILFVIVILLSIVGSLLMGIKNMKLKYHMSEISLISAQYQMQAMQAQIKPHFIYNILDSIKWMILDERTQDSAKMLNELSRFLRLSFGKGNGIVKMSEEMECLTAYVKLMQDRYNKEFEYSMIVEENTYDCRIPKFTLQPLVENALLHGLLHCERRDKRVTVRSWKDEQAWYIEVEDNGNGMPQAEADQLLEKEEDVSEDSYGLYNIRERLCIFTENKCRMKVISREGIGTCVCIEIANKTP